MLGAKSTCVHTLLYIFNFSHACCIAQGGISAISFSHSRARRRALLCPLLLPQLPQSWGKALLSPSGVPARRPWSNSCSLQARQDRSHSGVNVSADQTGVHKHFHFGNERRAAHRPCPSLPRGTARSLLAATPGEQQCNSCK